MKQFALFLLLCACVFETEAQQSTWTPAFPKLNSVTPLTKKSVATPTSEDLPWVRWADFVKRLQSFTFKEIFQTNS